MPFLRSLIATMLMLIPVSASAEPPRVATDIAPVTGLVARVMDGVGAPIQVLPRGASPHGHHESGPGDPCHDHQELKPQGRFAADPQRCPDAGPDGQDREDPRAQGHRTGARHLEVGTESRVLMQPPVQAGRTASEEPARDQQKDRGRHARDEDPDDTEGHVQQSD